jgi:hypothetical protein
MRVLLLCTMLLCSGTHAATWKFDPAISVSPESKPGVFVHLESAGRKSIALSDGWVAIVWEDNRDDVSRCYVALKETGQNKFNPSQVVSGSNEAAEPAIVGIGGGRFALAWEENGQIWARIVTAMPANKPAILAGPVQLSKTAATQASLAYAKENGLYAVWSEQGALYWQIRLAKLHVAAQGAIHAHSSTIVDTGVKGDQSYPSIAEIHGNQTVVAWEDRSAGHTRLLYAVARDDNAFLAPQQLNEAKWRDVKSGIGVGGTGVMRVALTARGQDGVAAVWADKRDFQSGYDVYGSFASSPKIFFGANEKVQDEFGDNIAQWHPAIAANASGRVAVVWDDDRDGSPDVWLAWRKADGWSGDVAVPGASGPGVQSDPSIAMDEAGNLYLAWVEKTDLNSPSKIRFAIGRVTEK